MSDITNNVKIRHYPYSKVIKTPTQMNEDTEYDSHIKNIKNYVNLLYKGQGPASKVNNNYIGNNLNSKKKPNFKYKPLGFKYFLSTGTVCKDIDNNNKLVDRSQYINNIVSEKPIGLINGNKKTFSKMKHTSLYNSLKPDNNLDCKSVSLETRTSPRDKSIYETGYLTVQDVEKLDPCLFRNKKNPSTNKTCSLTEGYKNYTDTENDNYGLFESEYLIQLRNLYFVLLILLFSYVLIKKSRN
tara:strand:+ start:249 stop:974 length:726 start_codon:yes stop_codon:yes gene_type:complete